MQKTLNSEKLPLNTEKFGIRYPIVFDWKPESAGGIWSQNASAKFELDPTDSPRDMST